MLGGIWTVFFFFSFLFSLQLTKLITGLSALQVVCRWGVFFSFFLVRVPSIKIKPTH